MVTNELVNDIILGKDPNFDEADRAAILWQFQRPTMGGFQRALWDAIEMADGPNLARLGLGFPVEVQGHIRLTRGDLAQRLRAAGKEANNEKETE